MYWVRQLFCKHDWELILENEDFLWKYKTYRCRKCGKEYKYKC